MNWWNSIRLRWLFVAVMFGTLPMAPAVSAADDAGTAASAWVHTPQADVRLVAAVTAVGEGPSVRLGLQFALKPHWKIYWRSPGDAGYPPSVDWSDSDNLAAAAIAWPAPVRFSQSGIETAGYEDEVVLPVTATLKEAGRPLTAKAVVDFLICKEICVPQHAEATLSLPAGSAAAVAPHAHLIDRFVARVPGDGAAAGLRLVEAAADRSGADLVLQVVASADPPLAAPDLFVEGPDGFTAGKPDMELRDGGRTVVLRAPVATAPKAGLAGLPVTLTVVDGGRAMEAATTVAAAPTIAPTGPTGPTGQGGLPAMLGVALLGGLILNLMPCVLPVLSLKVLGLIDHAGGGRAEARRSFVASAAGIMASFLALAAAAVAVKMGGAAVGWGIQFQQPVFLAAMIAIVGLFAANLWGLFEITPPQWLYGVGAGHGNAHSLGGHFLTGAFATLLATPCTAPFLGTAIGFALSRGPAEIVLIFAALGLGMASPYLAVAALPGLATRLPRPGRWMVWVRMAMGATLAGTAAWLVGVLAAQVGLAQALTVGGLMTAALAVLGARRALPDRLRPAASLAVVGLAGLAIFTPGYSPAGVVDAAAEVGPWSAFDRAAIARHVADGRTVMVDVTADWCVTCQVNKAAVLNRGEVFRRLGEPGVIAMRADWTRPNEDIGTYLASFGRYGIPFNAVYGPVAPDGIALPELLTTESVLKAMDSAGGVHANPQK